jgi:hypothetical protein
MQCIESRYYTVLYKESSPVWNGHLLFVGLICSYGNRVSTLHELEHCHSCTAFDVSYAYVYFGVLSIPEFSAVLNLPILHLK